MGVQRVSDESALGFDQQTLQREDVEFESKLYTLFIWSIMCFKTTKTRPAEAGPPLTHKRTSESQAAHKMRILYAQTGAEIFERRRRGYG